MNVTLKQLRYLRTAAKFSSISDAAHEMHISQSSISAAIDRIEQEFALSVFVRQPSKGLLLTQQGRQFLTRLDSFLDEADHFAVEASGLPNLIEGDLNLACFAALSPHVLPSILKHLTQHYPGLSTHLHEGHLRKVQELLLDGTVDVALTYDLGLSDRIDIEILADLPPHVVLPKVDPLVDEDTIDLKDLVDKPMILLDLPESRTYFELIFQSVDARPRIAHRTETYEMVRSLVGAGLGFSLLNLRPIIDKTYDGSKVVCRPLKNAVPTPRLVLAYRKSDVPSRLTRAFADSCRYYFSLPQSRLHTVRL